ncbi:MAG: M48 family metalloprotease, partial [Candidatus Obscuribacterales bacterium]|nr:M48 family metalloprotease [Candidatus Obscuribacterales bacterium]
MNNDGRKGLDPAAVSSHLTRTWIETIAGIALLAALSAAGVYMLGIHWSFTVLVLFVWVAFPIWGWYKSADMVKKLMHCQEPDPHDPRHQRLVAIVDQIFPKTGLPVKPSVYVSPLPLPNAFATGRNPHNAFVCATEGLLFVNLTDRELEAILAHELAHVKSRDVTITSMTAVLGSLFSLILAQGIPG